MNTGRAKYSLKKLAIAIASASASVLIGFSASAGFYPGFRFFSPRFRVSFESEQIDKVGTIIEQESSLSKFNKALKLAGLTETLAGKGEFTVFAPTNAAFEALPVGTWEALLRPQNRAKLVKLLKYHMVDRKVTAKDIESGKVETLKGNAVKIKVNTEPVTKTEQVTLNDAKVIGDSIAADNGVLIAIDKVLMPEDMVADFQGMR